MNRELLKLAIQEPGTPFQRCVVFIASGFGAGWAPVGPGTAGSLVGIAVAALFFQSPGAVGWTLAALMVLVGFPLCHEAARILSQKDPQRVVWDEMAAMPLVFAFTPLSWVSAAVGFLLFRVFDILKPWPISRLERLPGGVGIMADDLAAGFISGLLMWPLSRLWM